MAFSWAAALDVGLGLVQGLGSMQAAKGKASASNAIRQANNEVQQSQSMLARTIQNINNKRVMERAGKNQESLMRSYARLQDSQTRQGFEASIAQAEAMGQAATRASAMGVGGSAIAMASSVASITAGRQRAYLEKQQGDQRYEALQATTNVMGDALRSLSNTYYTPQQDYSRDTTGSASSYLMGALTVKSKSLQTLLGSFAPNQASGPMQGPPWLSPWQGYGTPEATQVQVTPVPNQTNVVGTPLSTITLN